MKLLFGEFVLMFWCCFCFTHFAVSHLTLPSEVSALLAIKGNLIDPKMNLVNWKQGDPCTSNWRGVMCYDTAGSDGYLHVKELQLLKLNLSGSLAPELGKLSQLKVLDFMWNQLNGSIPKEIGNISSLKLLLLNGNKFTGSMPEELGYLSDLNRLQVDQNFISGPIPKSFSNLNNVQHLHFNNNSINGHVPPELSLLPKLVHLLLDNNNLSGYLPEEFSILPELRILQLDNNNFYGAEIPASYGNISKLVKLSLRNCSLRGVVPDLSSISNLTYLDLSWNELSGSIPSNKLSIHMTTIKLSYNNLSGSIPASYSDLPALQKLSLENNLLTGSIPAQIWHKMSFSTSARLIIDLRNNWISNVSGILNPPANVTLRLQGNPICTASNIQNIRNYCGANTREGDDIAKNSTNSKLNCPIEACPEDNNFEYVPEAPVPCFCASPLLIGYRLKSPSFSYFPPYMSSFLMYVTSSLNLDIYQLSIDSYYWEKGPRMRMSLKLFPLFKQDHSSTFNLSEIIRIRGIFTSWEFPGNHFFGPYELLNFSLEGPYSYVNSQTQGHEKIMSKGIMIIIILAIVLCVSTVTAVSTYLVVKRLPRSVSTLSRKHCSSKLSIKIPGIQSFTYREMVLATDDFNITTQVGQGGYGNVYRGTLSDKTEVAIKRASEGSLQGQTEFLTEIEILSRLHHRNLVSLVGYCDEDGEQMLVYEFMSNGTVRDCISDKSKDIVDFSTRLGIALGAAKGILYLHTEANPPIFHRDIKASNILLDSNLVAKVADFGLSRVAPILDDEGTLPNHVSTVVKGTPGYLDPEYFLTYKLTDKSDVYSIGVVFLELLTGMRAISHGKNIVREVNLAHEANIMFSIIDRRMGSYYPSEIIERFTDLALRCCQDKPENRPFMLEIVRELENLVKLMMPETTEMSDVSITSRQLSESSPHFLYGSRGGGSSSYVSSSSGFLGSDLMSGVVSSVAPR
ncbi:probable LRR receptor-like serine/threonine-protein kinase At1g06840 [Impatiens glandulifera]|uniref:probable LRR receptor-like serine/threonine-protein kinase At1g06840 n=1 Tax=Impatiens glandulifera TaxID=253017 RepID=UPI001FB08602|nr:probable LRR receptor-like serine/threonine-protein kinase At1g06840 [Impatiens glandulifera]